MLDPKRLRELTNQAIARGKEESLKESIKRAQEKALLDDEHKKIADRILSQIPRKCEQAAIAQQSECAVMRLVFGRDYQVVRSGDLKPNELMGPSAIVYLALQEAGLKPTLRYGWSGDGMDSWQDIFVNW